MRAAIVSVTLALLTTSSARAQSNSEQLAKRARDLFRGAAACEEARAGADAKADCAAQYRLAARVYQQAFEAEPLSNYLFNRAQAERMAGQCASASALYRAFLESDPAAAHREVAERQIDKCREQPAAPAPDPSAEAGTSGLRPVPPPLAPPVSADADDAPLVEMVHWQSDGWGHALLALGAGAMVAGGVVVGVSYARVAALERRAERGDGVYGDHLNEVQSLQQMRAAGWITLGAGGALALGALVRYLVVDGSLELRSARVRIEPRVGGGIASSGHAGVDLGMTVRF
jgi:hypothetical protein